MMKNVNFTNLIYRIIGKPETWHDEHVEIMHQILNDTDSFDDPANFSELAFGDKILSRLQSSNDAIAAFNSLLDKSRFQIIILDQSLTPIYHNSLAKELFHSLICPSDSKQLKEDLLAELNKTPHVHKDNTRNTLYPLKTKANSGNTLYFRSITSSLSDNQKEMVFHLLIALDSKRESIELSNDFMEKYCLTNKEKLVLLEIIKGKSIKKIAADNFVSDNTVKTHLKSLYAKTNTNSQSTLVGLALTHESQMLDAYFDNRQTESQKPDASLDKFIHINKKISICYREYGNKDGRPLIVFHNGFGCRVTIPKHYQQHCDNANRRIIIPDRPGFGKTPLYSKNVTDWFGLLDQMIEKLEIEEFDVLGNVLGCPLALSYVSQDLTKSTRIKKLILTCPIIINHPSQLEHLKGVLSPAARLVNASKLFSREIYELWLKSISMDLDTHYKKMLIKSFGVNEKNSYLEDGNLDVMIEGFREGISMTTKGVSHEMVHSLTPLNLDLSKMTIPVDLWLGSEDDRISLEGVKEIANELPNVTLHFHEGYSEHLYYSFFEKMIR